jgi:hypothetical protein
MTQEQRNYMTKAIINSMPLIIFKHEQDMLETMMAKYVDPKTVITEDELKEDVVYLDKLSQ